jgi:flagellar basal-body rod protein FlgC
MGMFDVLAISSSGLRAQRNRLEVIATNLANVHTTRTEEGGPYKKKDIVFASDDVSGVKFGSLFKQKVEGVKVDTIQESNKSFEKIFDPAHPDADKEGYVTLPNVNVMEEMVDMMSATRSYEANTNVISATKHMFMKAIEILK